MRGITLLAVLAPRYFREKLVLFSDATAKRELGFNCDDVGLSQIGGLTFNRASFQMGQLLCGYVLTL